MYLVGTTNKFYGHTSQPGDGSLDFLSTVCQYQVGSKITGFGLTCFSSAAHHRTTNGSYALDPVTTLVSGDAVSGPALHAVMSGLSQVGMTAQVSSTRNKCQEHLSFLPERHALLLMTWG
jgi:hypothetical protein